MRVAIFEDQFVDNLKPFTLIRPSFALRCGPSLLYEKVLKAFPNEQIYIFMRRHLCEAFISRMQHAERINGINNLSALRGDGVLLLNGRWIVDRGMIPEGDEVVAVHEGAVVYAYLRKTSIEKALEVSDSVEKLLEWARKEIGEKRIEVKGLINYPWDLVEHNRDEIRREFNAFEELNGVSPREFRGLEIMGDEDWVFISRGARIYPNVVFDTSDGPIIIDEGAIIFPFTVIFGPSYVGRDSWVVGGKIREGTAIGPVCRVGGEVEESIIHGYGNKYHEGFLGHSYVGEWVNLGALTTVSDLKNDYSNVEVYVNGKLIDTGRIKVGSFIGDHTKTGIGTLLTTGSNIGIMCNLVSDGRPPPKYMPSFTWYIQGKMTRGPGLKKMLETARIAMSRRNVQMTKAEEELFQRIYEETREERDKMIELYGRRGR
ncbi:MAG: putative sugar nucleotidyl transferase [Nitrososphaerota archaeon]|nr:putative sugar nucleotidyl transferase [Nitrososphaerota archaeon]